jgi:hypothetical protein
MLYSIPELYDSLYEKDIIKMEQYYTINRVHKLGEYAIFCLAKDYKYRIMPHYLVRGGQNENLVLDVLRHLRTAYFFNLLDLVDLINRYIELIDLTIIFINNN